MIHRTRVVLIGVMICALLPLPVFADRFQSTNYTIDAGVAGNSAGGVQSSSNYALVSSGGESIVGNGTGGSYKLGEGYVAQLEQSIELSVSPATVAIGTQTPGVSNTAVVTATIRTDAPGYTISAYQNNNLTSGGNTISGVTGSIASPVTWVEGTTKGLGFTLVSTTGSAISGIWSSGTAYAAFPASDTAFYTNTGFTGGTDDTLVMEVRLDTLPSQPTGAYTNIVTWTGVTIP